jgi:protoporphyrin/coproporphyrin ferrochelatase
VWTERQALALGAALHEAGHHLDVRYAMRYGNPSIAAQLDAMKAAGCNRILILPSYPQYSGTTTASVLDAVYTWAAKVRRVPEFRFVNNYHDHHQYTNALAHSLAASLRKNGAMPKKLVLSFHGVPERTLHLGDTYHCECFKTARLVGTRLRELIPELPADFVKVTFQSRFGKAKWLEPYTEPTLIAMAQQGIDSVAVACPGFTVDCLETLEEISLEAREAFLHAGGKRFDYLPCLNAEPAWAQGFAAIAAQHLQGWPTSAGPLQPGSQSAVEHTAAVYPAAAELSGQASAAKAMGAKA